MRKLKRSRLRATGWQIGDTREFLKLSSQEAAYIELKLRLAGVLRRR